MVPLKEILRPTWMVPETTHVNEVLQEFRRTRQHMAMVVDEYEAVRGVVTIEDALEEIVGEIRDEHDLEEVETEIKILDDFTAEVLGHAHLDEVNEELGTELPEPDDLDTVAGLVINQLGFLPDEGEVLDIGNLRVTVLQADRRRVQRVRIERIAESRRETA